MKKNISLALSIIVFSAMAFTANAQQKGKVQLNLNYNYSLPMGSFKNDIISDGSARGFSGDLMFGINKKFAAGLSSGFQDFYQKYPRDVYTTGDHEVTSAVLSNSIQTVPLLAKGSYMPLGGTKSFIQPYVSLGAGISLVDFRQYLGEFGGSTSSGNFTAQGGAGIMIPFDKKGTSGFNIGAIYNYVAYKKFGYGNLNSLAFQAGVHFPLK